MGRYYRDYADFLRVLFPGKMQKLTVNAGFSCPNRDGTLGRGGCAYCNNASFSPLPFGTGDVTAQLEEGKRFFGRKYPEMRYLAYFQSYTNTHAPVGALLDLYEAALGVEGIDGLIIGTRPDCVPDELLHSLSRLECPVIMEYGAESSHDTTLYAVNRCHTWRQTVDAVRRTADAGLRVGLHFIMGLPGETEEMMIQTVERMALLPVDTVKFHQLQIIRGTAMERYAVKGGDGALYFKNLRMAHLTVDRYLDLCVRIVETLQRINPSIAIERFTSQAPEDLLVAPKWGVKNYQFVNLLHNRLCTRVSGVK